MDMKENKQMGDFTTQDQIEHVLRVAMAQVYSLKKGLKAFGQDEKNTVQSELQQHHDMDTSFPIVPSKLMRQQRI